MEKTTYTSGQAAKFLGVPSRTVRRYLSNGRLPGVQHPITGRWVVHHEALIAFQSQHGRGEALQRRSLRVAIVGVSSAEEIQLRAAVEAAFEEEDVDITSGGFDLLFRLGDKRPDLVLVQAPSADPTVPELIRGIRHTKWGASARIAALVPASDAFQTMEGADAVLAHPVQPADLAAILLPQPSAEESAAL